MKSTVFCLGKTRQSAPAFAVLATLLGSFSVWAQAQPEATLRTVTVKPSAAALQPGITGFADEPIELTPISAKTITDAQLVEFGARRLSDVLRLDASATDAYNAIGYWDYITLRGFVLEPNQNFRRDGLPISTETSIGLENKEGIELLKGISGIQAGTSAPGGLVNFVVKRPTEKDVRTVRTETSSHGGGLAHLDIGGRFGADRLFGYRLNVATEAMRNHIPSAKGQRSLLALAMDWRIKPGSLLEVELEQSKRSQPGVPGLSLVGNQLPAPNPFTNINNQPWSQPGVMKGLTGSVRYEQALGTFWRWSAHASSQNLNTDDYLAYPYGCFDVANGSYYADRYCPNGDFDLYDYRSLMEKRKANALEFQAKGSTTWAGVNHHLTIGVLQQRQTDKGQTQADNNASVGLGNIYSSTALPSDATFNDPYTNRNDRSTELFAYDRTAWSSTVSTWVGLRHTKLDRNTVRTDGSRATHYRQTFTTPWLALAWLPSPQALTYASFGQGIESFVAPGRNRYTNEGQALAPLKSRQWEAGVKQQSTTGHWSAALFRITRPRAADAGACDVVGSCTFQVDGDALHQGLELTAHQRFGDLSLDASTLFLHAKRRGSSISPSLDGLRPTNVPKRVLRFGANYAVPAVPGLSVHTLISHESNRHATPDGSISVPSWITVDASLAYRTVLNSKPATWRLAVSNLANKRYFKESPFQFGHIYLFAGSPRTWRLGMEAGF